MNELIDNTINKSHTPFIKVSIRVTLQENFLPANNLLEVAGINKTGKSVKVLWQFYITVFHKRN